VRGTVRLKSSAGDTDLARLKAIVDAHCPVLDVLQSGVPVALELAPVSPASAAR
jgi:hypothetical protein